MRAVRYNHAILVEGGTAEFDQELEDRFTIQVSDGMKGSKPLSLVLASRAGVLVPRGLQKQLKEHLAGHAVEWIDARERLPGPDVELLKLSKVPLYPHQLEACKKLLSHEMGVMDATTSAGKGNMIPAMAACFPTLKVGIFTKDTSLVKDLEKRIPQITGEPAGVLASYRQHLERITVVGADWIVAQVKSGGPYANAIKDFQVVFVDECHGWATDIRASILRKCTAARYRYGLSGTSLKRSDGRTPVMVGQLGPVTCRLTYETLLEAGVIAEGFITMVLFDHTDPQDRASYTDFYAANIYNNHERNKLVMDVLKLCDHPAIVFAERTQHVKMLGRMIAKSRYDCVVVYGKTPQKVKESAIARAAKGDLEVLVGSRVLFTGNNMPAIRAGVMTDAGKSAIQVLQKTGRLMRKDTNKTEFRLYDICDMWPHRKSDGSLAAFGAQSRDRYKEYVKAGLSVSFARVLGGKLVPCANPFEKRS